MMSDSSSDVCICIETSISSHIILQLVHAQLAESRLFYISDLYSKSSLVTQVSSPKTYKKKHDMAGWACDRP